MPGAPPPGAKSRTAGSRVNSQSRLALLAGSAQPGSARLWRARPAGQPLDGASQSRPPCVANGEKWLMIVEAPLYSSDVEPLRSIRSNQQATFLLKSSIFELTSHARAATGSRSYRARRLFGHLANIVHFT